MVPEAKEVDGRDTCWKSRWAFHFTIPNLGCIGGKECTVMCIDSAAVA